MKCNFKVVPSREVIENKEYETYGISAICNGVEISRINSISPNREEIESLAQICNDFALDSEHLKNIVEDFIVK